VTPSAASPSRSAKAKVTATIDGLSTLPHRVHWEANPSVAVADVSEVDFLIDSQLAWTEKNAPYFYGDDGNWLVTSFLKPGRHQFETRLVTLDGQTVSDTVEAGVGKAAAPPTALSGGWARVVSTADLSKESPDGGPPAGHWTLKITDVGWVDGDPEGGGGEHDVAYVTPGRVELRPTIEHPVFPNSNNGGWCHEPDPEWAWRYVLSAGGRTMRLHPVGKDPCGNRAAIYEGTWTRTSG